LNGNGVALAARIRAELIDLKQVVQRATRQLAKAHDRNDEDYLDGVALNLHAFYAGVERIFEEIAREIDDSLPDGPDWHRTLLTQMAAEVTSTRPPVIDRSTRDCLDEYRGFRRVVRNVYTFSLRPSRLEDLVSVLAGCHSSLTKVMAAFCNFLDKLESDN
jgi:hypothetical protein